MRPDWEHVVPGMVDALGGLPGVDADSIILVGRSFGGLVAPRGAAGEPRLAALIVDPGQYDMGAAIVHRLGPLAADLDDPGADAVFQNLLQQPAMAAMLGPRMTTHGITSVRGYFQEMTRFHNRDTASRIGCPSFVADNETDPVSTGQGRQLYDALSCPKDFRLFTRAEGAEGHCEGMAPIVFWTAALDWLDELRTRRPA
jgi:pimeloyl-ACP methyl ester carboxylesterase